MQERIIRPVIGRNVYVAPTAYVGGEVTIGDDCTIMHHVTIRGDVSSISIGREVNVQDGAVIHTETGVPLEIHDQVVIGHHAVVHCRRVGSRTLIGIGSILLDRAEVGQGCVVAAGAVVPPGMIVPDGKMVVGIPARIIRDVTDADRRYLERGLRNYERLGRDHAAGRYPNHSDA